MSLPIPKFSPVLWHNTQSAAPYWEDTLGASGFITRAIRYGVYEKPLKPLSRQTGFRLPPIPVDPVDQAWLESEMTDCLRRQIYQEIPAPEALQLNRRGYPVSNAFVVTTDKRRLVINLSRQSDLFRSTPVKMETLESFALELDPADHLMSFDIQKGYHHFRLHPDIRNWFIFVLAGRYYRCIALPFGWKLSPSYFIKIMRPFVRHIRVVLKLRIHPYMDDFLIAVHDSHALPEARRSVQCLLDHCGLTRKIGKGCWEGAQEIDHLGFRIDTVRMVFGLTDDRLTKLHGIATLLLRQAHRNRRLVDAQLLRHFCGVAVSCTLAMPLARFYTRSLYDSLSAGGKGKRVKLVHAALRDLKHWRKLRDLPTSRQIRQPKPSLALHSDASTETGQGGTLGFNLQAGTPGLWEARGVWDPQYRLRSINFLELRAVTDNLRSFTSHLRRHQGARIKLWEDNQAVVHIVNSMTTRSPALMKELRILHRVMTVLGITIESEYLPSAVNCYADRLSRLQSLDDWRINQQVLTPILNRLPPTIDRYAAEGNTICERFNSEHHTPHTLAVNALAQSWSLPEINYWNPPLKLLSLTVTKIFQEQAVGTLVTPYWPAQSWFARLLSVTTPLVFRADNLYLPPSWAHPRMSPPPWQLAIWQIHPRLWQTPPSSRPFETPSCEPPDKDIPMVEL